MLIVDALQYSKPERERFLEWREGKVDVVHVTIAIWEDSTETLREVGRWKARFEENSDIIVQAKSVADLRAAREAGKTAVILGFQNSTPFESDLDLVAGFAEAGVMISQLTYNTMNSAGSGCWEDDDHGLSRTYGVNLVKEMNRVGMVVDISHSNEKTCFGAFEASDKPVAITHANPIDVVGASVELSFRNKSLPLLKTLAEQGGVLGLSMYPRIAPNGVDCTLDDFCNMVDWTVERIGIDHVGFGSDFYIGHADEEILWWRQGRWSRSPLIPTMTGYVPFPAWFGQSKGWPNVLDRLRDKGYSDEDLTKLAGENWVRLFEANWVSPSP